MKKALFEEENTNEPNNPNEDVQLKPNIQFANSFNKRKQREMMDQAKAKYGKNLDKMLNEENGGENSSSSSENGPEDDNAELLNENIENEFINLLAKIRTKHPDIYQKDKTFFQETQKTDEQEEQIVSKDKKEKKLTYRDIIREKALKKMDKLDNENQNKNENEDKSEKKDEEEDEYDDDNDDQDDDEDEYEAKKKKYLETPFAEQLRYKDEFKRAAQQSLREDKQTKTKKEKNNKEKKLSNQKEGNNEDKLFKIKNKSVQQIEDENFQFEDFLKQQEKDKPKEDVDVLKRFWGNTDKMNESDKFLRKYILTKGWEDKDLQSEEEEENENQKNIDEEDEKRDEEMDQFEEKYNFRFEEPGANQITTYSRNIQDSLRQKDDKRKSERENKKQKSNDEKIKMSEEIKRLKNVKKSEIQERLNKITKIAGSSKLELEKIQKIIDDDFDESKFDKIMSENFDQNYYEDEDENQEELQDYIHNQNEEDEKNFDEKNEKNNNKDAKIEEEQQPAPKEKDKDNVLDPKPNLPIGLKQNLNEQDINIIKKANEEKNQDVNIFWFCDNCKRGLQPKEPRFDCQICPDYTLCKKCNDAEVHNHKMKKLFVPSNAIPPKQEDLDKILSQFSICQRCFVKLNEESQFYKLKDNEKVVLCEDCFDSENPQQKKHYEVVKPKVIDLDNANQDLLNLQNKIKDDKLKSLINDYYQLDFEDVIAGGIKTRFQYIDVKPESYNLSDEHILYGDQKALNNYVSIKKLAPYRDDEGKMKSKSLKNKMKLNQIHKSAKLLKYQIRKENSSLDDLSQKMDKLKKKQDIKSHKKLKKLQIQYKKVQLQQEKAKQAKQKEDFQNKKPKLQLEDLTQEQKPVKLNVSENRLKSYGLKQ